MSVLLLLLLVVDVGVGRRLLLQANVAGIDGGAAVRGARDGLAVRVAESEKKDRGRRLSDFQNHQVTG